MPDTKLMSVKMSFKSFQNVTIVALLTTLVGCASNYNSEYPQTEQPTGYPQTQQPQGEPQLEEIIVTANKGSRRSLRKKRSRAKPNRAPRPVYDDAEESHEYTTTSGVPILRENSAQQIFKDYGVNPTNKYQ